MPTVIVVDNELDFNDLEQTREDVQGDNTIAPNKQRMFNQFPGPKGNIDAPDLDTAIANVKAMLRGDTGEGESMRRKGLDQSKIDPRKGGMNIDLIRKIRSGNQGQSTNEAPSGGLSSILAMLKGLSHIHQTHHWQSSGPSFYGDHLMFQRLYEATSKEIDGIAEKAVGLCCEDTVNAHMQMKLMTSFVNDVYSCGVKFQNGNQKALIILSLKAEKMFLNCVCSILKQLQQEEIYTIGLENFIQGIVDNHESSVYLLKQRLKQSIDG